MVMIEDTVSPEADEVYYQTPEELKVKGDPSPDVVHDDSLTVGDYPDEEIPDVGGQPQPTPIDAIRVAHSDPANVSVSQLGDKYYIGHDDLKCYMDASGETNYDAALDNIVTAHDREGFTCENTSIVMSESELLNLDPDTKLAMESSEVNFEVYA